MTIVEVLATVIKSGGQVALADPSGPVLRIPATLRPLMVEHRAALRALADRVQVFTRQRAAWITAGRLFAPTFALPDAPVPAAPGTCFSCAEPMPAGRTWRCHACASAVALVLEMPPQ